MPTAQQHDWVASIFGVDPRSYPATGADSNEAAPSKTPDLATQPEQHVAVPNEELFHKDKPISDADIHQGVLGDCYLLSSIGEIARINPDIIRKMIKDNHDGTYTVTLHRRKGGFGAFVAGLFGGHPEFEAVEETVDGNFPTGTGHNQGSVNQGAGQDETAGKKEIWLQVLEKAFAKLHGGYSNIGDGAWPKDAMETLTGQEATHAEVSGATSLADLQAAFTAGKPMVFNTPKSNTLPFGLVGPHAYMLEEIKMGAGGKATLVLRNPWGYNPGTSSALVNVPFEALASGIGSVDIGGALPKQEPPKDAPPGGPAAPAGGTP